MLADDEENSFICVSIMNVNLKIYKETQHDEVHSYASVRVQVSCSQKQSNMNVHPSPLRLRLIIVFPIF